MLKANLDMIKQQTLAQAEIARAFSAIADKFNAP